MARETWGREHSHGNTWTGKRGPENTAREMGQRTQPGKHGAENTARETQSRVHGQGNTVSTSHVWHTTPAPLLFLHNSWMDKNRIENETNKNNIIASNLQLLDYHQYQHLCIVYIFCLIQPAKSHIYPYTDTVRALRLIIMQFQCMFTGLNPLPLALLMCVCLCVCVLYLYCYYV